MKWRGLYLRVFWIWATLAPVCGFAQIQGKANAMPGVDAAGNSQTVEAALHQMSDQASVVFIGTVTDVHRTEGSAVGGGIVEIQFEVEQAIRGCSGSAYTLREWGGLWAANDARYRVGQSLLMFLHAPSATGLSSPIGGMDGAIPLRASGAGVRSSDASAAAAGQVADLRWIGAKLARKVSYRPSKGTAVVMARSAASNAISTAPETQSATPQSTSTPAQEAAVSTVVGMLRSWEVGNDATR